MAEDGAREVVRKLVRAEDGLEADADALSFHVSLSLLESGIRRGKDVVPAVRHHVWRSATPWSRVAGGGMSRKYCQRASDGSCSSGNTARVFASCASPVAGWEEAERDGGRCIVYECAFLNAKGG